MRIYIAHEGETLITIAKKQNFEPADLISLNPHISNPLLHITGQRVNLPSNTPMAGNRPVSFCPPVVNPRLDQWIPLTPLDQMADTEYDVLVVGTGAGGGAVIWRLCEKWQNSGKRIGVVEAGGLLLPTHVINLPTLGLGRHGLFAASHKVPVPAAEDLSDFPEAKQVFALGGRTLFWGTISPRLHPSEFAEWPLTYEEINPYYNIAEQIMNVGPDFTADSTAQEVLFRRLQENGFPNVIPIPFAAYTKSSRYGEVFSNPFFSSINFLAYALNRHPFDLAINARCVGVLAEKDKVFGVSVMTPDLRAYRIKAKRVVLAAGALETPRLLLSSGIPGKAIGHYLLDHSFVLAKGKTSRKEFPEIPGNVGLMLPSSDREPFQIQMQGGFGGDFWYQQYQYFPSQEDFQVVFFGFGKVQARYENRVSLAPAKKDRYGVPLIQIRFSYSERDYVILSRLAAALKLMAAGAGVTLQSEPGRSEICVVRPGGSIHDAGTCRMGDDPSTSATNRFGQVHGISGLYAADNSVLPTMGGTNPTLTTIALAIRTADYIASF